MTQIIDNETANNDFTPKEFFIGILKHWLLIILLVVISIVGTVLFLMVKTTTYTSSARILLEVRKSELTNLSAVNAGTAQSVQLDAARDISNQVQYLLSLDLAKRVDKVINFNKLSEFKTAIEGGKTDSYTYFASKLKIGSLPASNVLKISYTANNPTLAAKMVNTITEVYKQQKSNEDSSLNNNASNWLAEKVRDLQAKQRVMDAKIVDYRIKNGIFLGQNNQRLLSERLSALNTSIAAATAQRVEVTARSSTITNLLNRNGNLNAASGVLNSSVIQQYRQQILTIQRRIVVLSETLLPSHPNLVALNAELNNVNAQVRTEAQNILLSLRNEAQISRRRENSLKSELDGLKNNEANSLKQEVELNVILREASANRTLLDSYLAKFREADVRNKTSLDTSQVHVISPAVAPLKPAGIKASMIVAVMGVVAFLIGILIAVTRTLKKFDKLAQPQNLVNLSKEINASIVSKDSEPNSSSNGVKNKDLDDTAYYSPKGSISFDDLAFMSAIPSNKASKRQYNKLKNDILAHLDTEYADSFLDLADNLMVQSGNGFQKHFMISGIKSDETYETLLNLGRILDMEGVKTLILDFDANSLLPTKTNDNKSKLGFLDIINGDCELEDCVIDDNKSNLKFMFAGSSTEKFNNIITSVEMEEFLDALDQVYDVILIHSNDVKQKHVMIRIYIRLRH
ncbi:MAG: hypothetical protein HRU28_06935 [Rhizobiales bacterium]|nr:hypothetical protein [Hyphomicrobiales bacterium]